MKTSLLIDYLLYGESIHPACQNVPKSIIARELRSRGLDYTFDLPKDHDPTELELDILRHLRAGWTVGSVMAKYRIGRGMVNRVKRMFDVDNYFENQHMVKTKQIRAEI